MKLYDWLRNSLSNTKRGGRGAHMTWARTSVGHTISRTGVFLKRQIWLWPILAVLLLSVIGLYVRHSIESTIRAGLRSQLETIVELESSMLDSWSRVQSSNAQSLANSLDIRQSVYPLLEAISGGTESPQEEAKKVLHAKLEKSLGPALTAHRYSGYLVADKSKRIVASNRVELIGQQGIPEYDSFLTRALEGASFVSQPYASIVAMKDESGRARTGIPSMAVVAPIRDDSFQVVGVLALRIDPTEEFTRIMQLGRFGDSGETYAVDRTGQLASESRFDEGLALLGLILDEDTAQSILNLRIADPGGDMMRGHRPGQHRRELPLTLAATEVIAGRSGVNVDGYRDYRGVQVVGAWKWLEGNDVGVITEVDYAEAFRPLTILRRVYWGLFALLAASAAAIFVFTILLARSRREAQRAVIEAQQVGQYKLEQKLGSGGMGVVYKAHHAMLRRPTAVKMLDVDKVTPSALERFEREVQITSQLNNPSTVAIYDYGRTPEGVFYYAMEYLDGIDLQSLVERYGPQPVPRVIHILQQVCGSLYEAHSLGLVHRDIKPANIMLNRRGGQPDVVKVLDFGLVKALDEQKQAGLTQHASLTGTPLYMSPEAIQLPNSVDARSDLYAVGAVGYFLLTGVPVFEADNVVDLCQKHVATPPSPLSERTRTPVPSALEAALLACLEKSRAKRPQTARDLAMLISRCTEAGQWSLEDADAWWGKHERQRSSLLGGDSRNDRLSTHTTSHRQDVTIDHPK
ncbi:MAG: serine/threonine protein kinase [Pirellulales bacterium]|nr:serine/threonine protein kinase [Pirellulales bacterium]